MTHSVSPPTDSGQQARRDWPEPCQSMTDLSGWREVDCSTRQRFFAMFGDRLKVYSTLTDPEGQYGAGVVYTEWGSATRDTAWLRDYRWTDRGCVHYMPAGQIGWPFADLLPLPASEVE